MTNAACAYYLCVQYNPVDSIGIYSIDGMVENPSVSAFQNFLRIENWLNIKKVMGRNVWMCFVSRGERPLYTE